MSKTKTPSKAAPAPEAITGTYRYDQKTGEVVLVSSDVPKVASKGKSSAPESCGGGSCDDGPCGGGRCGL